MGPQFGQLVCQLLWAHIQARAMQGSNPGLDLILHLTLSFFEISCGSHVITGRIAYYRQAGDIAIPSCDKVHAHAHTHTPRRETIKISY